MQSGNAQAADMLRALRSFLRDNDVMAYITHISVRMLELHRVLKPTGSIYLHCDPTASHYLKVMMDAVFGKDEWSLRSFGDAPMRGVLVPNGQGCMTPFSITPKAMTLRSMPSR
jgi:hypothetical protein